MLWKAVGWGGRPFADRFLIGRSVTHRYCSQRRRGSDCGPPARLASSRKAARFDLPYWVPPIPHPSRGCGAPERSPSGSLAATGQRAEETSCSVRGFYPLPLSDQRPSPPAGIQIDTIFRLNRTSSRLTRRISPPLSVSCPQSALKVLSLLQLWLFWEGKLHCLTHALYLRLGSALAQCCIF